MRNASADISEQACRPQLQRSVGEISLLRVRVGNLDGVVDVTVLHDDVISVVAWPLLGLQQVDEHQAREACRRHHRRQYSSLSTHHVTRG